MTYRDRRLARAERLRGWAEKREARSAAAFKAAKTIADGIPFGQPILIGHHSEKRARRDQEKIHNGMRAGCDHADKAVSMAGKAEEIERQAEIAIYSDDVDAIDRLQEKIAGLEAERARIKVVNSLVRKHGLAGAADQLTEAERTELVKLCAIQAYYHPETKGFPPYVLTNLGGNISRLKKRLSYLSGGPAKPAAGQEADPAVSAPPVGATATERAGLRVVASMTTPSRPGKLPRPVWNVFGNLADWRPMLTRAGGSFYRGAFSFWEDPTNEIELACLEYEADTAARMATEEGSQA
jgi:hypothetical protein